MEEEIWKVIPETERRYFASNLGRIKSFHNKKIMEHIMKPDCNACTKILYQRRYKNIRISKLVWLAFHPEETNYYIKLIHKNGNKFDSSLNNLVPRTLPGTAPKNKDKGIDTFVFNSGNWKDQWWKELTEEKKLEIITKELNEKTIMEN